MSVSDQAKQSEIKYSAQAISLLDHIKDDFDLEEFESWVRDNLFIIGSMYIVDYLNFRIAQKENANKKPLCNPQK